MSPDTQLGLHAVNWCSVWMASCWCVLMINCACMLLGDAVHGRLLIGVSCNSTVLVHSQVELPLACESSLTIKCACIQSLAVPIGIWTWADNQVCLHTVSWSFPWPAQSAKLAHLLRVHTVKKWYGATQTSATAALIQMCSWC